MTLLVAVLTLVLVLQTFLVLGLLRSHAAILRRLEDLGAGLDPDGDAAHQIDDGDAPDAHDVDGPGHPPRPTRTLERATPTGRRAHDLLGATLRDEQRAVRVVDVDHDTVIAFLSSGCLTCGAFWERLDTDEGVPLPEDARLVVVAKDLDEESPSELERLAPAGVTVLLSSAAWRDYGVPGSPYVVHVDGESGRVVGEGTGQTWEQVARLLAQATADAGYLGGAGTRRRGRRRRRAAANAETERDIDRALLSAGILPGDESLYQRFEGPIDPGTAPDDGATGDPPGNGVAGRPPR